MLQANMNDGTQLDEKFAIIYIKILALHRIQLCDLEKIN